MSTLILLEAAFALAWAVAGILSRVSIFSLASGVLGLGLLAAAWGVRGLKPWGWVAAVVIGVIGLIGIPIGTIVWSLVLVYLFKPEVRLAFAGRPLSTSEQQAVERAKNLWRPLAVTIGVLNIFLLLALVLGVVAIGIPRILRG